MDVIGNLIIEHPVLSAFVVSAFVPNTETSPGSRIVNGLFSWAWLTFLFSFAHK